MSNQNEQTALAELAPEQPLAAQGASMVAHVADVSNAMQAVRTMQSRVLREGIDFGVIPGTGSKPTLLKPGAESLLMAFRLTAGEPTVREERLDGGHIDVRITIPIIHRESGNIVGYGVGSCSTLESKYRYRQAARKCPQCGQEAIIKGKAEYGGGWICFKKQGGCGAKFGDQDKAITGQRVGKIDNPDIADLYNTVRKIAKKRALIDGALTCCAASGVFTQDVEDLADHELYTDPRPAPAPQPERPTAEQRATAKAAAGFRTKSYADAPLPRRTQQQAAPAPQAAPPAQPKPQPDQQPPPPPDDADGTRPPLPQGKLVTVRLSKGRRTDTATGPVLRWMAQDVANPLRYDWIWCWHRNQPVEATGQQDPENFEGEVQVKLSVQFTTRTNRTTGAEEQVNYYRVEEIKHA